MALFDESRVAPGPSSSYTQVIATHAMQFTDVSLNNIQKQLNTNEQRYNIPNKAHISTQSAKKNIQTWHYIQKQKRCP